MPNSEYFRAQREKKKTLVRTDAVPESLQRYLRSGLRDASIGAMSIGAFAGEISKRSPDSNKPAISESRLRKISADPETASAYEAWIIGRAFGDLGVPWSSGPLALAACDCHEQLMGVLGHLLEAARQEPHVMRFLVAAPFKKHVFEFCGLAFEERQSSTKRTRVSKAERAALGLGEDFPSQDEDAECRAILESKRLDGLLEQIAVDAALLALFDAAWETWTASHNRRHGTMPFKIAKCIDAMTMADHSRPHDDVAKAIWTNFNILALSVRKGGSHVPALLSKEPSLV